MGNCKSIVRYDNRSSYYFYEGDQVKYIHTNENFIYLRYSVERATEKDIKRYSISGVSWKIPMVVNMILRDNSGKIIKKHLCCYRDHLYFTNKNIGIENREYYVKNEYEIACRKKMFNLNDIKNYPDQIFIEIDGIFDISDAIYGRTTRKYGIVTNIPENGRAKMALIYNLPQKRLHLTFLRGAKSDSFESYANFLLTAKLVK